MAHNPKVGGSNPSPATTEKTNIVAYRSERLRLFKDEKRLESKKIS